MDSLADSIATPVQKQGGGITLSAIYQSGMVFQRGEPITVRGTAEGALEVVEVTLADSKKTSVVTDGRWSVTFDPMYAAQDLTLTVECDGNVAYRFDDVAIGDVFILSGQSNMDYETRYLEDYEEF